MTSHPPHTVGELRAAIERWQSVYGDAAVADRGAGLLASVPGVDWRVLATEEINFIVLNLSFWLLREKVALWEPESEDVDKACWRHVHHFLRRNEYGRHGGRYIVRLYGARGHPLAVTANNLAGARPDVLLGELYGALGFELVGITDQSRAWTPVGARRIGDSVIRALSAEHTLELRVSLTRDELLVGVQADHERLPAARHPRRFAATVADGLRSEGYRCGGARPIASNAWEIPLASSRDATNSALVMLPNETPPSGEVDAPGVLLLPTARVFERYQLVVAPELTGPLHAAAQGAGVPLRHFDSLLHERNRRALSAAVRALSSV